MFSAQARHVTGKISAGACGCDMGSAAGRTIPLSHELGTRRPGNAMHGGCRADIHSTTHVQCPGSPCYGQNIRRACGCDMGSAAGREGWCNSPQPRAGHSAGTPHNYYHRRGVTLVWLPIYFSVLQQVEGRKVKHIIMNSLFCIT